MQKTPRSERLHIGLFGKRNAGKSAVLNRLTGREAALVSDVAGTTTDPVYQTMELHGLGPAVFIDTPGLDDVGTLGEMRVERTQRAANACDLALFVFDGPMDVEKEWIERFLSKKIPVLAIYNKIDQKRDAVVRDSLTMGGRLAVYEVSAVTGEGIEELRKAILQSVPETAWDRTITGELATAGDLVLLVMPQDIEAPAGRLILPQVQTIRELLDKKCSIVSCTPDTMERTLSALAEDPHLIITDSQAFEKVYALKPETSLLTSFSILFAGYKGDVGVFREGAQALQGLTQNSRILIAEACTHAPVGEDIGTVKIPGMLRRKVGPGLMVDHVRGDDFPADLSGYDLIIHCGGCMFNRRHMMQRVEQAQGQGVPITNYGIVLAYLTGILDRVVYPE